MQNFLYSLLMLCVVNGVSAAQRQQQQQSARPVGAQLGAGLGVAEFPVLASSRSSRSKSPAKRAPSPAHAAPVVAPQSRAVTAAGSATAGVTASSASIPSVLDREDVSEETRHCAAVLERIQQREIAAPGAGKIIGRIVHRATISDIARQLKAREDQTTVSAELQAEAVQSLTTFFGRDEATALADHGLDNAIYVIACLQRANYPFSRDLINKILPFVSRHKKNKETALLADYQHRQADVEEFAVVATLLKLRLPKGERDHSPTTGYRSPRTALATMLAHSDASQQQ